MIFVQTKFELNSLLLDFKKNNELLSFVPTMGNLHEGHLSLIDIAKKNSSKTIVSIFVNPLQFGKNEDFEKYPRTLDDDLKKLKLKGCDIVFFPKSSHEVFNEKDKITQFKSGKKGQILCGKDRPGHFDGVLTVVYRLFELIKPNTAIFGKKDFQQQYLIKKMSMNFFPKLKILTGPIIRDKSGLALSSRNSYLSKKERKKASFFYLALKKGVEVFKETNNKSLSIDEAKKILSNENIKIDYLELMTNKLENVNNKGYSRKKIILGSIKIGKTKLIDNIEF